MIGHLRTTQPSRLAECVRSQLTPPSRPVQLRCVGQTPAARSEHAEKRRGASAPLLSSFSLPIDSRRRRMWSAEVVPADSSTGPTCCRSLPSARVSCVPSRRRAASRPGSTARCSALSSMASGYSPLDRPAGGDHVIIPVAAPGFTCTKCQMVPGVVSQLTRTAPAGCAAAWWRDRHRDAGREADCGNRRETAETPNTLLIHSSPVRPCTSNDSPKGWSPVFYTVAADAV